jgi:hypothetical protein
VSKISNTGADLGFWVDGSKFTQKIIRAMQEGDEDCPTLVEAVQSAPAEQGSHAQVPPTACEPLEEGAVRKVPITIITGFLGL